MVPDLVASWAYDWGAQIQFCPQKPDILLWSLKGNLALVLFFGGGAWFPPRVGFPTKQPGSLGPSNYPAHLQRPLFQSVSFGLEKRFSVENTEPLAVQGRQSMPRKKRKVFGMEREKETRLACKTPCGQQKSYAPRIWTLNP